LPPILCSTIFATQTATTAVLNGVACAIHPPAIVPPEIIVKLPDSDTALAMAATIASLVFNALGLVIAWQQVRAQRRS